MIRHIVMFKLKDFGSAPEKSAAANEVLRKLNELPEKIAVIRRYKAGIDVRKLDWSYDIVLEMDFDTLADLETYTLHPAHLQFITFNKNFSVAKTTVDFEI